MRQQREQLQSQSDVRLQSLEESRSTLIFPGSEKPCFEISKISIEGLNESLRSWEWLYGHIDHPRDSQPVLNRCLGAKGVGVIMARLQHALVQKGWTTTRVVAPPQDLSSGELQLDILEGVISDIRFEQEHGQRAMLFNTVPARTGQVLNLRDIEQGLENLRRVPTVAADVSVEPGEQPGQSDLVIRHAQDNPLRVLASVDDSGDKSTGKYQGAFTLSYDNPLTLSDLFYITLQTEVGGRDSGDRGNSGYALHYSVPWGYGLLSLNGSSTRYHQTVSGAFQDYVYSGESDQYDAKLSHVLQRDHAGKTTTAIRAFHRRSHNYIDDTEVEVQRRVVSGIDVSLGHRRSVGDGLWDAALTYRRGIDAWGALPAPEEAFGEGTSRMRMWLVNASVRIPFEFIDQHWSYHGVAVGQWHDTPLTPQDRFTIGGRYSVRGFDGESILSGDSGLLIRNEISTLLGQGPYSLYLGLDWGRVSGQSTQMQVGDELAGAVIGLRSQWELGSARSSIDLFLGQPIYKPEGFRTASQDFGFSINLQF
ncbi:ShlB/FhaC/HecB family hemolysin secretion/activation protein [Halomonas urumqiensis]|uniref:ShlB/FhaC/HecB family hemolysin secretion/activation protein n=1 Tax=Halomonas urumqiensis TaxID=1684789 RepID=UPI0015E1287C|nr:ShlB/FhaC/HecB family hemolysin secretion/activation protein [Halomonas urumqiensis]GHE21165.1 hemolysin secretion/activation protein, ShlB/FhaC/HecB family [Halomonas urumqiensis]